MLSYSIERKHKTNIGSTISKLIKISRETPKGSFPGTILFNIYVNDLFLFSAKLVFAILLMTEQLIFDSLEANPGKTQFTALWDTEPNIASKIKQVTFNARFVGYAN